jgi:rsbT co-antagonist protein RsbR
VKSDTRTSLPDLLDRHHEELLADWIRLQVSAASHRPDLLPESELRRESSEFLTLLRQAARDGNLADIHASEWNPVREMLAALSRSRVRQGFAPGETASFVLSFKQPLFALLRAEFKNNPEAIADNTWNATLLLDKLGLHVMEIYHKSREEVIRRQQQELLELSTPVVRLWDGVLALPLIGVLDSARTQVVMESLLKEIMVTGSSIAIIDITGVPMVDTLVAQHLLKTVAAARLMGADCIISGIRPQIAQTIVHLGVALNDVVTKATLADAFRLAMTRLGLAVMRANKE